MRKWLKVTLWASVPILAFVGLGGWEHFRSKWANERAKAQLRAKGELFRVAELVEQPFVSDSEAAIQFKAAKARLGVINYELLPGAMRMAKPGRARVAWKQAYLPNDKSTNIWPDLRSLVEEYEPAAAELRKVLMGGRLRFAVNYGAGFEDRSHTPLVAMRSTLQWFSAATIINLREGQADRALENLRSVLALTSRYEARKQMIDQLVRFGMVAMAGGLTWEALQYPEWSGQQLAEMQGTWQSADIYAEIALTLRMERAFALIEYEKARRSSGRLNQFSLGGTSVSLDEVAEAGQKVLTDPGEGINELLDLLPRQWAWKWWSTYDDESWFLGFVQVHVDVAHDMTNQTAVVPILTSLTNRADKFDEPPRAYLLARLLGPGIYRSYLSKAATAETQRRIVFTAIALHRFQRRHGKLPADLAALVPEFLAAIPFDPMDGQPLRYRVLSGGQFLLYSVGLNGTDEGGDPQPAEKDSSNFYWTNGKDWV